MVVNQLFLQAAGAGGGFGMLVPLILIVFIMYFFMIRPQSKKQKEIQRMIDALKKGDKVVTIGGIHGTIAQTKEKTVIVKVDDNTKIEFNRTAIATVTFEKPVSEADKKAVAENSSENAAEGSEVSSEKTEEQKAAEAKAKKYAKIRMIVILILIAAFVVAMIIKPKSSDSAKADAKEQTTETTDNNGSAVTDDSGDFDSAASEKAE